jgi:hypothetical protein
MATVHNLVERIHQRQAQGRSIDDYGSEIVEMLRSSLSNDAVFHGRLGYYICWPDALEPDVREKMQVILNGGGGARGGGARGDDQVGNRLVGNVADGAASSHN